MKPVRCGRRSSSMSIRRGWASARSARDPGRRLYPRVSQWEDGFLPISLDLYFHGSGAADEHGVRDAGCVSGGSDRDGERTGDVEFGQLIADEIRVASEIKN